MSYYPLSINYKGGRDVTKAKVAVQDVKKLLVSMRRESGGCELVDLVKSAHDKGGVCIPNTFY